MKRIRYIFLFFCIHDFVCCSVNNVHHLRNGDKKFCCDTVDTTFPVVYCYGGKKKQLENTWETAMISISLSNDLYERFEGSDPDDVMNNFQKHQASWSPNIFAWWRSRQISLNPFNSTCVGILTNKKYVVNLQVTHVDYVQISKFVAGLLLYFYASKLANNQFFYYICGISLGICFSVVILVYLFSRILPNKMMMYGLLAGGWTVSMYFAQYLLDNAKLILLEYKQFIFGYILVSGLISFVVCYRFGPPTNHRSKKLIQWSLQVVALLLIMYSSYLHEVVFIVDVTLIASRIIPFYLLFSGAKYLKRKLFRPRIKIKLLTEKEYEEQGRNETKKSLDELRGYCSSPECKPWKTILKLKDPIKFASFIEGMSHISSSEAEEYDSLLVSAEGNISDEELFSEDE